MLIILTMKKLHPYFLSKTHSLRRRGKTIITKKMIMIIIWKQVGRMKRMRITFNRLSLNKECIMNLCFRMLTINFKRILASRFFTKMPIRLVKLDYLHNFFKEVAKYTIRTSILSIHIYSVTLMLLTWSKCIINH